MLRDDHKAMSRRALEMWVSNNSDRAEDIFAERYINHQEPDVEGGVSDKSLEVWKDLVSDYHKAFFDSKLHVFRQIAEGDGIAGKPVMSCSRANAIVTNCASNHEVSRLLLLRY
ncbi:MAG: ester cyclase [Gammaproteobacteria bacterium]|jgi:hypothetical protein